jgi:hypothetical protein
VGSGLVLAAAGWVWWLWSASKLIVDVAASFTFFAQNTLSLFVFLAVVAQALIYVSQRRLMHQQWLAMQDALAEAKQQTKIARDSLMISQQAYVGIHSVTADLETEKAITITIENIGKAPAKDIRLVVTVARLARPGWLHKYPETAGQDDSVEKSWQLDWKTAQLFPGNLKLAVCLELGDWLTDQELTLIVQAYAFLHVEGYISYNDGFGRKEPTRFALTYVKGEWLQFSEKTATKTQPDNDWKKA